MENLVIDKCYHCGEKSDDTYIHYDDKDFCCVGCKNVYALLKDNGMCDFYALNEGAGKSRKNANLSEFLFLDEPEIEQKLVQYKDDQITKIELFIPQIHCSSCIWLLENLNTLNPFIQYSSVNFTQKTVDVQFKNKELSLRQLAELLTNIGYEPVFNFDTLENKKKKEDRSHWYRIGVAGFSFGNIMLLTLPEYFDTEMSHTPEFQVFFRLANIAFSLPVLFYSSTVYLKSAWKAIRSKTVNIDIPIAIGLIVLYGRSLVEIGFDLGPGYLDSFCALVFFMSIGRAFQQKTYEGISFDKDFGSFFPISIQKWVNNEWKYVAANEIHVGDKIRVKNKEIIPADSKLISEETKIEASFVTGESREIHIKRGELVYAGCKVSGKSAEFIVEKEMAEGHLTKLWNHKAFQKEGAKIQNITDRLSYYFTPAVGLIGLTALLYHGLGTNDWGKGLNALTAVLIIACPCALGLAAPFGFGTAIRLLAKRGLFIKNAEAVEQMSHINHVVFDKTGTLTVAETSEASWQGIELSADDFAVLKSITEQSSHPLSLAIYENFKNYMSLEIETFIETSGKGIETQIAGNHYKLGSASFVGLNSTEKSNLSISYFKKNDEILGRFVFKNKYRAGITEMIKNWGQGIKFSILSGDNDSERENLANMFNDGTEMLFHCSPEAKLEYIEKLEKSGQKVAMLGDGLNDAGALKVAHLGIGVADNNNQFSPASDAILRAEKMKELPKFFASSKYTIRAIKIGFVLSLLYNVLGISVAVIGNLSPVFATILMPISSITVVITVTSLVAWWVKEQFEGGDKA